MAQMPDVEQGYSPPSVRQFSVFLDNRVGKLLELLQNIEARPDIRLAAISVLDSSDYAVIRMIFSNADAARHLLSKERYTFSETSVLVVEMSDTQTISSMCLHLLAAEVNIRFVYPVLMTDGATTIALGADDVQFAGQILLRKRFRLLGEEDFV
ncbi:MAG: acetolactate synthase [Planctomycetota bacterium]|nr:acetolactate synthase [Planctomycetota bacterium]